LTGFGLKRFGPNDLFPTAPPIRILEHMFEPSAAPKPERPRAGVNAVAAAVPCAGSCAGSFSGSFEIAFVQFSDAVAAMVRSGVPADARALVQVRSRLDQLAALVAEASVRFDTHELWRDEGAGSMRAWLSDACGLSRADASREARRYERLERWPEIATAWINGSLSGAQVDAVVAGVPNRFIGLFAEQAATVVPFLTPLDVVSTAKAIKHWEECAGADDDPDQFRERPSGLYCDRLFDGHMVMQGTFDGTDTAIIEAALRVFDTRDCDPDPGGDPSGDASGLSENAQQSLETRCTPAQRRAAALVEACRFALDHRNGAGEHGRFQPHVSLIVDISELRAAARRVDGTRDSRRGTGVTSEGTDLGASALVALTCDSVVQRVLMAGNKVLDLGREVRTATPAQRRAIIARDLHCRAPGCRTLPKHCEVHHIDHWINGGRTDLDRLVLLCGTHHRLFHRPGYRMELDDQATFTVHAPRGSTRSSIPDRISPPELRLREFGPAHPKRLEPEPPEP
jgi:hypothetical protein